MREIQPILDKPISQWAEERIRQIEITIRSGHFSRVRFQVDELESKGLHHDPVRSMEITLDDYLITLIDQLTANRLESQGILTFRQFLQTSDRQLLLVPEIGPQRLREAKELIEKKFGQRRS